MPHPISATFNYSTHYVYNLVTQVISFHFKLCEKILSLFKSKVPKHISNPAPISKKPHKVSRKLTPTESQAATKIQRWYRNKLVALDPALIKEAKNIMRVSENNSFKSYFKSCFTASDADARWEKLQKFTTTSSLTKDHYVFAHSSSFSHAVLTDMRTYLDSPILFPATSSRWDTYRKFRSSKAPLTFKNVAHYFKSNLCKDINSGKTTDDKNRHLIISCDSYLGNKGQTESANYFFKSNSSWFSANSTFINSLFKEHIKNKDILSFATSQDFNEVNTWRGQGRVYLIAIPKQTVAKQDSCYVWRSHAYGKVCPLYGKQPPSSDKEIKEYHKNFTEVLEKHQKGISATPHCHLPAYFAAHTHAQYRILADNLNVDLTAKVLALDSLNTTQEKNHKEFFWQLATLLKQCKRLESISKDTPKEDLVSILLRTRFNINHLKKHKNYFQRFLEFLFELFKLFPSKETLYTRGIASILNEKKDFLLQHSAYLQANLPPSTLKELNKIGIFFIKKK